MTPASGIVAVARVFVLLCWMGFFLPFLWKKGRAKETTARRALASRLGIVLQGCGYFLMWFFNTSTVSWAALHLPAAVVWGLCVVAMLLAAGSAWMGFAAIRALGRQWSLEARVLEGHRMVVEGPYSHVRHPIYTAMLGMLVSAGIVFSVWWALIGAVVIYSIGTAVRVRAEEGLLREAFGEDFEAYARYVPAVVPRWRA